MLRYALLALPLAAAPLLAQAPRITPKGDPSVADDSIYRLAVQAKDYPQESYVVLLDDGVLRFDADGKGTETYRQVVQVLKDDAIEQFAEHRFSYSPERERLTLNWLRVVGVDGKVISAKPALTQDADVPAAMSAPVYSERKVRRATLAGVAVGTIVDYSFTREITAPVHAGDWSTSWSVNMGVPVRRSRVIVDVPAGVTPRIEEHNLDFQRVEQTAGGRHVFTWARKDVPKLEGEPFAADSNDVAMHLAISSPTSWGDIASWYAGLAKDRYAVTPALAAKVDSLVRQARTRDDSIRAVHRWVAQDVRYVSVSLGIGGFQPRQPDQVIATGFGDCKDKATLFVAALEHLGITAYPVLLSSDGGVRRALPSIGQFDHAIAAVAPRGSSAPGAASGAGYTYVDLTTDVVPYGRIPGAEQGEFGLVVHPDGSAEEITFPRDSLDANATTMRITGAIGADGMFNGRYEEEDEGGPSYGLRGAFSSPLDSARRVNITRALAQRLFDAAEGDSLVVFDGKDLGAAPRISMLVRNGRAMKPTGDLMILKPPMRSMQGFAELASELEARKARRYPIDAADVIGRSVSTTEVRLRLPAGWTARLPKSFDASSPFGSYSIAYAQAGDELRITRHLRGSAGVLPKERMPELIAWLRTVGQDANDFIVLEHAPATVPAGARR